VAVRSAEASDGDFESLAQSPPRARRMEEVNADAQKDLRDASKITPSDHRHHVRAHIDESRQSLGELGIWPTGCGDDARWG
jgi:hypothetical protein